MQAKAEGFVVPALKAPVNDYAKIIPSRTEAQLNQALRALKKSGGSQISILTIENLGGSSIEQASIQVTDQWKLGGESLDNGVLLLIALKEKKIRIEVGQGLEGLLTDAHSKRIIDESMVPMIRSGDFPGAVMLGSYQVAQKANPSLEVDRFFSSTSRPWKSGSKRRKGTSLLSLIIYGLIIIFFLATGRGGLLLVLLGSSMGRGGGFRSRGGGGFGGGGGGFSGGGASGGW